MRELFSFTGKSVIVTGGSLGIGAAAVRLFAERGAIVTIASRDSAAARPLVEEAATAGRIRHVACDVASEADVEHLMEDTVSATGRLDVLVNNAGIYHAGTADQTSLANWNRVMAVNLTGTFLATRYAVPHLENSRGRIVNVSSEAGLVGIGGQVAYNVSKTGMIALTKSCAIDYARRGIRVTCVCPGTTWTPLVEGLLDQVENRSDVLKRLESSRPENRLGTAEEVASAILYLASDEAAYATGAILSVDGGYTVQ